MDDKTTQLLEVVTQADLCGTRQLNVLQLPEGRGGGVVAVDELLARTVVGDVVDVQIGLDGLAIGDAELATDEGVPLHAARGTRSGLRRGSHT